MRIGENTSRETAIMVEQTTVTDSDTLLQRAYEIAVNFRHEIDYRKDEPAPEVLGEACAALTATAAVLNMPLSAIFLTLAEAVMSASDDAVVTVRERLLDAAS
jgi:hypothetical protein